MSIYKLKRQQLIQAPLAEVWAFFSDPANLAVITPPDLDFVTTSEPSGTIYAGQVITYTIRPVAGVKMSWMTEISHLEQHRFFVDEQRKGPYKLWHHQHHFEQQGEAVLMTDIVHYMLPLGLLGSLAHRLFVRRKLEHIFDYRFRKVDELFNGR